MLSSLLTSGNVMEYYLAFRCDKYNRLTVIAVGVYELEQVHALLVPRLGV